MSKKQSNFSIWWNSENVQKNLGAAYSLGASVVIIGAMFKILHLPFSGYLLGVGMTVEALLFGLGVFDQPHKEYEWDKIYDFDGEGTKLNPQNNTEIANTGGKTSQRAVGLNYNQTIDDEDVKKLTEGIKNLTSTANQLSGMTNAIGVPDKFVKNIEGATEVTAKFIKTQDALNNSTGLLTTSYQGIAEGIEAMEKNTKQNSGRIEDINKNLSSINSLYELQLKSIQAQTDGLTEQTANVKLVSGELNKVLSDVQKMKSATVLAVQETENYKAGTEKLAKQVADLNQVYGNMLNALN